MGFCLGAGYDEEVRSEQGATVLDRESSQGREDQREGRGETGQKGGAVGVGAQLSAKHRRPETSEGAQRVMAWPSMVTQSLRGSALQRPRQAPWGGSLEPSASLIDAGRRPGGRPSSGAGPGGAHRLLSH